MGAVLEIQARVDVTRPDAKAITDPKGEIEFVAVRSAPIASRVCSTKCSSRGWTNRALVGGSGVGKSIAYLATRLLDPDAGVVRFDGHDLRSLQLSVRWHIVLVEQEPTLLHASIEENIRHVRPPRAAMM
jgi:ATP-binding cassette subfamily B protein